MVESPSWRCSRRIVWRLTEGKLLAVVWNCMPVAAVILEDGG